MFKGQALAALVTGMIMLAPVAASAAGLVTIVPSDCNGVGGCTSICDLAQLANNALTDFVYIAVFLSAALFAWAGITFLTARGNTSNISRAKEVFTNVFIGLVIILAGYMAVDVTMRALVGQSLLPWSAICPNGQ